ncbi:hypothetical protein K1719_041306 [Acacia pycnantha]|nr:hypothetical protein K1719_041306 [Acacia pycnantha]
MDFPKAGYLLVFYAIVAADTRRQMHTKPNGGENGLGFSLPVLRNRKTSWKARGELHSKRLISQKWTLFLCLASFCAGMFFINRMWTIPEPKELARLTPMEAQKLNVVSEGCNSRILREKEVKRESKDILGEVSRTHNAIQTLDKTISNLEIELAAARATQDSLRSGAPPEKKRLNSCNLDATSATSGGILDRAIEAEDQKHGDLLKLDHVEGYLELSAKTKTYFTTAVNLWDADFYVKVDDDVHVNIATLGETLVRHRSKPRIYIGCMKSGPVLNQNAHLHGISGINVMAEVDDRGGDDNTGDDDDQTVAI